LSLYFHASCAESVLTLIKIAGGRHKDTGKKLGGNVGTSGVHAAGPLIPVLPRAGWGLFSFHPETPDEKLLVSDSERRAFLSRQGNQEIARRRTSVRRTSKPED
jgi:hypothetical protein